MNITIFGTGYVGLVHAAVLASLENHVLCVDNNVDKISQLNDGLVTMYEPGLYELIHQARARGFLSFSTNAAEGVQHSNMLFITVGTPCDESGGADLTDMMSVAETIANHMNEYKVIVNKSTAPVGTADLLNEKIKKIVSAQRVDCSFDIVVNPEFLKQGSAVADCLHPDRIIIGTNSLDAEGLLRKLYEPLNHEGNKILVMDVRSAELTKYAANCMLATKISFINEIALLAEKLGANIDLVREGMSRDPRIGHHFIYPGVGYGLTDPLKFSH